MTNDNKERFGRIVKVAVWAVAALVGGVLGSVAVAMIPGGAIPTANPLVYTGELADGSGVIDGAVHEIRVAFFDDAVTGDEVCSVTLSSPILSNGRFTADLPSSCEEALMNRGEAGEQTYVEVSVTRDAGDPPVTFSRSRIGAVPYAVSAAYAGRARNFTVEQDLNVEGDLNVAEDLNANGRFDLTAGQNLNCQWIARDNRGQNEFADGHTLNLTRYTGNSCPGDRPVMRGWRYDQDGNNAMRLYTHCCALRTN